MTLSSPMFDKFRTFLWPRKDEDPSSKLRTNVHASSSGLQSDPRSVRAEASRSGNAHLEYLAGGMAPPQAQSVDSSQLSQQPPDSQLSDLEILHARLSNAHLLAHHQFELHPASGVTFEPRLTAPIRHRRQPSPSLLPRIQSDPQSSDPLSVDAQQSMPVQLTQCEKEGFQSLGVPSALCCIRRSNRDLIQSLICFESLNEGAANSVFSINPWNLSQEVTSFVFVSVKDAGDTVTAIPSKMILDKVLRVSKGLPKSLRSEVIVDGFMADVRPLFVSPKASTSTSQTLGEIDLDKHLMAHLPVVLFNEGMSTLKEMVPAIQPLSRTAQYGILLPDMSTVIGQNVTFEVKPKWLAQSPAAPAEAIRCRTCALQFSRGKGIPEDYICPLRLSSEDVAENRNAAYVRQWATRCLTGQLQNVAIGLPQNLVPEAFIERVVAYFLHGDGRTLILHLKKLQATLDSEGILQRYARPRNDKDFVYDLRLAMTLRDCSLFVVVPLHDGDISSKLADLDFKSAEKIDDWRDKEATLVAEGWYLKDPETHNVCLLSPMKSD